MRYIDADKYKADLLVGKEYLDEDTLLTAINLLDCQPTADVMEVKHGEWILLDDCSNEGVYCSECHKKVYRKEYANQKVKSKFCPNCGAIMDGKRGNMERYINADALHNRVKTETNPYGKPTLEYASGLKVLNMIKQAPTADVVEVVRCKECKLRETSGCPMYREEYSKWDDDGYTEVDLIVTDLTEDEGFCHCGTKIDKEKR